VWVFYPLSARRFFPHMVAVSAVGCFSAFGQNQGMPTYYIRTFGLSPAQVGLFSVLFTASALPSVPSAGYALGHVDGGTGFRNDPAIQPGYFFRHQLYSLMA
jgi:hypothetical protein